MAKLGIHEIRAAAKETIGKHPGGIRFADLVRELRKQYPETNGNTIYTQVSTLQKEFPAEIVKPSRGLFQLAKNASYATPAGADHVGGAGDPGNTVHADAGQVVTPTVLEKDFYESFGNWLKDDLDEATHVVPLGGAGLKGKWGTPDVVGVYKPSARDVVKFPLEIVAAEVKIDPAQPIVAFGQAAAYRLFSHRVYIAMPRTLTEEDDSRLESLCLLFGFGLVLFDLNKDQPDYTIRVRAQTHQPDAFFINQFADRLFSHNAAAFEKLFG